MKRTAIIVCALVLCLAMLPRAAWAWDPIPLPMPPPEEKGKPDRTVRTSNLLMTANIQTLGTITRSQMLQQLNKQMTFEGFFYNGSIPMLVQNMDLVRGNTPLPPDKYIPIVGPIPSSFKPGAKVRIGGQVQTPAGQKLQGETVALQLTAQSQAVVVQAPPSAGPGPAQFFSAFKSPALPAVAATRYALLIGGGKNPAGDYFRYWNDLWMAYQILTNSGYPPANIRVAYSSGVPRTAGMPVNYPATGTGIQAAFGYFVPRVKVDDMLYIMLVGQSSPPGSAGPTPVYWAWQGIPINPGQFSTQVNRITTYRQMIIQIGPSYAGAFIPYLTKPKRVIIASSAANKDSWAHPSQICDNFEYWYLSAFAGFQFLGEAPVNADANGNGQISLAEAYNFTLSKPGGYNSPPISAQMPQFEDNGAPPSRWGTLPGAGEGLVGLVTYL